MPTQFPAAMSATASCPEIGGSYSNLGIQRDGRGVFLSNVLGPYNTAFAKKEERALAYRRVALMNAVYADVYRHENGALDITLKAVDRDLILHPLPGKKQELACRKGWLLLKTPNPAAPFGMGAEILAMTLSTEGGLLIKKQQEDVFSKALASSSPETALSWYYFPKRSMSMSSL